MTRASINASAASAQPASDVPASNGPAFDVPASNGPVSDRSEPSIWSTLRLLQLCSPAFPIGAFAYSQALEQAAELEWVHDAASLQTWLCGLLEHNLARTDLPLIGCAFDLWQQTVPARQQRAEHLCDVVCAHRETAELRAEEQHIGRALARLLSHMGITAATPFVEREGTSYLVMFALAAAHFDIRRVDALTGFAFSWAENQIAAASRVIRLGQMAAQGVLSHVVSRIPAAVAAAQRVPEKDIGYSSPASFLASAWHEEQYSRLFRS